MNSISIYISFFIVISCQSAVLTASQDVLTDTALINIQTRDAYIIARQNPDFSIFNSHKALKSSIKINYKKGMADASLALGMAYLAKFNTGDSATFYNLKALSHYKEIEDITGKARACYGLSYVYSLKGNLEKSENYSRQCLNFFEQTGDKLGMVNALNTLIYLRRQAKDNDSAVDLSDRAIEIIRSVNDTILLADALNTRGNIYNDMFLLSEAIDFYFEALNLWEIKNDSSGMAIAYGSIGVMYFHQEEFTKALEFYHKKLSISEKVGDLWEITKTLNNISQIYTYQHEYDSSFYYLRKGLILSKQMNYPASEAGVCASLASAFLRKGELDSAKIYINRSIALAKEINDPALSGYLITKGHVLKREKRYSEALTLAIEAFGIAEGKNDPNMLADSYALLSDMYFHTGQFDLAYKYLIRHHSLKDSITNNEYLRKVTRLEIQNEYDRKQEVAEFEQAQQLMVRENKIKQQNLYVKGLVLLLILLGIISIFILRHNRLKARFANIDLEQRLLRAQMNPHFIFNSLCAVQDFILADKPKKANAFLVKIASLMRNILENSREEYISLDREIETLKLYLDIQQLRFEEEFEYSFNVDKSIDPENISVPPMLAQPCLENSIEHGLLPGKSKGSIEVSYTLKNNLLMLEVTDNGVGRESAANEADPMIKKKSISTRLTQKRLDYFRKTMKEKNISFEIIDLYNENVASGTKVIMVMPWKKLFA